VRTSGDGRWQSQLVYSLPAASVANGIFQESSTFQLRRMTWDGLERNFEMHLIDVECTIKAARSRQLLFDLGVDDPMNTLDGI
jgi:hypothetical protein